MRHSKKPSVAVAALDLRLLVQVLRLAAVAVLFAWLMAAVAGFQATSDAMAGAEPATASHAHRA